MQLYCIQNDKPHGKKFWMQYSCFLYSGKYSFSCKQDSHFNRKTLRFRIVTFMKPSTSQTYAPYIYSNSAKYCIQSDSSECEILCQKSLPCVSTPAEFILVFRTLLNRLDCIILLNCYKSGPRRGSARGTAGSLTRSCPPRIPQRFSTAFPKSKQPKFQKYSYNLAKRKMSSKNSILFQKTT